MQVQQDIRADVPPAAPPRRTDVCDDPGAGQDARHASDPRILEELLVEEVSIDGMCGVY